jgi:hypothetical protein
MGNFTLYNTKIIGGMAVSLLSFSSAFGQPAQGDSPSLGEAFNAGAPEVEPVVVGRERWNDKPVQTSTENSGDPSQQTESSSNSNDSGSSRIDELDPLETEQVKPDPSTLPLDPPKNKPATRIVRNFEGTLVFKPRKLGFAYDFPYQLENSRGKRLAFIDVDQLKAVDPQQFTDQQINVLGMLEPVEEGSDELVIRARVLRLSN